MDEKPPKDSTKLHIGHILPNVIRTCRPQNDTDMIGIWDIWAQAVGDGIAENTHPSAFKGHLLLVHVSSSVWLHQLQFMKSDLISKLNTASGNFLVEDIAFKIGPLGS